MINASPFIVDLTLILVVAALVMFVCRLLKQPLVLGYLLAGFLVGPHFPFIPTVTEMKSVETWAEIGVIFLLFTLGFNFTFKKLLSVGSSATIIALIKNLVMFSCGPVVGYFFNWPLIVGFYIGAILSITSTIVVARCLEETDQNHEAFASVIMGVMVVEDVLILLMVFLISSLSSSEIASGVALSISLMKKFGFVLLVVLLSLFLSKMVNKIRALLTPETTLIFSLALCLLVAIASSHAGLSPALGAFIAGMLLAETAESRAIKVLLVPIRDLFIAIFFVSVGMMLDPQVISEQWLPIVILALVMIIMKFFSATVAALITKIDFKNATALGIVAIPIGEFSFVIATLGISLKAIDQSFYSITVALSAVSILATTYLMKLRSKVFFEAINGRRK
ncbi:MAG: cation:proton antiporter [Oligoflexia bacterium]|nr:cation:proton antiporter [Oligoflexia bacterium]MBF0365587.1 cation:proton antiporter [Oligoflexia bacterium]